MPTRQQRKEFLTDQRKHQIFDAALRLFSGKGFGETTMPDIAQEAGVAVGTIYNYFENKHDLLVSLINAYVVDERLLELVKQLEGSDDEAALNSLIRNRLDFGFDNLGKIFFLFNEVQRDPELRRMYAEEVLGPVMKLLEEYLKSKMDSGVFRPLDGAMAARALVGMLIGFNLLCRIEGEESPCWDVSRQDLTDELTALVLQGFQKRAD